MKTDTITTEQKLEFLEHLLKKNDQIRMQYEQYFTAIKELDNSLDESDLDTLTFEIFYKFESIDTSAWAEDVCYSHSGYSDFYEDMHNDILEDFFNPYENIISSSISKADLYDAVFQIVAIYKAILKKPSIRDDEYYIFGDVFDAHVIDYISYAIIRNLSNRLQEMVICEDEVLKTLNFLINQAKEDEKFTLHIFTPFLKQIITNKKIAFACKESIALFSSIAQLHIFSILDDNENYIAYAKKVYLQEREVATLLLEKLQALDMYDEYVLIAQNLMEKWPSVFASKILEVIKFSKTLKLYKTALQERCLDTQNLQEYIDLKEYLSDEEIDKFRQRVKESYHQLFYIRILEHEKMYEEILAIAKSVQYRVEITQIINPIKNIYPEDVLLLVIEFCDKELGSYGRNRSTYQRMAKALHVIFDVACIHKKLQEYINKKLYNHTPRLPALRDELAKAGLV